MMQDIHAQDAVERLRCKWERLGHRPGDPDTTIDPSRIERRTSAVVAKGNKVGIHRHHVISESGEHLRREPGSRAHIQHTVTGAAIEQEKNRPEIK